MKFVTAIYNGLHTSSFNGRLNRDNWYLYSLRCLAGMGVDIICYTSDNDEKNIQKYLDMHNITNVTLKIFDLTNCVYHTDITRLKTINAKEYEKDLIWKHRCVEIMWQKLLWMNDEMIGNPDHKIFWIDAGISHCGILPKKFNSTQDTSVEGTHQNDLAFSNKLIEKLDKITDNDKMFTFYCDCLQHQYPELYANKSRLTGSIVAGLFGGTESVIKDITQDYVNIISYILENNTLLPEELILTLIYQQHPDKFNIETFTTWYHEDWDCYNPQLKSFSGFFEDLI